MRKKLFLFVFLLIIFLFFSGLSYSIENASLLRMPDIFGEKIVFSYAGDLWLVQKNGGIARKLTTHPGYESWPYFSPNGKWIGFSAQYDGNTDVYIIPSKGGEPTRLTFHPSSDNIIGWSFDGKYIYFSSSRTSYSRYSKIFKVSIQGGLPEELPLPKGYFGDESYNGKYFAYTPLPNAFNTWRRYRGGLAPYIWIFNYESKQVEKIPHPNCNDTFPKWIDDKVYFLSDRSRIMNLYSYDTTSKKLNKITNFKEEDIKSYGVDKNNIVFEKNGYLHLLNPQNQEIKKLKIDIPAELLDTRTKFVKAKQNIFNWNISPTGKRLVMEARGEIITTPAEKGSIRNLTKTSAKAEREPSWSPDGKWIAYFGEENGEYTLKIVDQFSEKKPKTINFQKSGYYFDIKWSPDSEKIVFKDNRLNLWFMDINKQNPKKIDKNTYFNFYQDLESSWSPDGKWIVYDKLLENFYRAVFVYNTETNKSYQITDGMSDSFNPVFDKNGKYIYFMASTNKAQKTAWLDMTSLVSKPDAAIYLIVLSKEEPSPFKHESDDEKITSNENSPKSEPSFKNKTDKVNITKIDLENIDQRIISVKVPERPYSNLQAGPENSFVYLEREPVKRGFILHKYDLKKKKDAKLISGIYSYKISSDGNKIAYQKGKNYYITSSKGKIKPGEGLVNTNIIIKTDPKAEWKQMLHEAWKINREWFYDPGMHGQDWQKLLKEYNQYLPFIAHRSDLNYVIGQLIGELCVSHAYVGGGDYPDLDRIPGGLLGADFTVKNNKYIIKKIYKGENWNPNLRAPLTEPGINIDEGDYILEINGEKLTGSQNIFLLLQYTAGTQISIKLNSKPSYEGCWEEIIVPVSSERTLRYRDWLESNRIKVEKMSNGKLGYVFLPNTSTAGFEHFNRYYFANIHKKGIVIDERYNGGGLIADYYISYLDRPLTTWWIHRYGKPITSPFASIYGPKVLLVNQYSASGGDAFPYLFKLKNIGKIIGKRTWGGLVGITGYPPLIDGGYVTAPSIAIVSKEGKFVVENKGVEPHIKIEITPLDYINNRDPQLEKAVKIALEQLENNPVPKFEREKFPRNR